MQFQVLSISVKCLQFILRSLWGSYVFIWWCDVKDTWSRTESRVASVNFTHKIQLFTVQIYLEDYNQPFHRRKKKTWKQIYFPSYVVICSHSLSSSFKEAKLQYWGPAQRVLRAHLWTEMFLPVTMESNHLKQTTISTWNDKCHVSCLMKAFWVTQVLPICNS